MTPRDDAGPSDRVAARDVGRLLRELEAARRRRSSLVRPSTPVAEEHGTVVRRRPR